MITDVSAAACKHPTEKLMRGGFGGGATPPTGGLGGRTPQKLGTKSVEYRLHIQERHSCTGVNKSSVFNNRIEHENSHLITNN